MATVSGATADSVAGGTHKSVAIEGANAHGDMESVDPTVFAASLDDDCDGDSVTHPTNVAMRSLLGSSPPALLAAHISIRACPRTPVISISVIPPSSQAIARVERSRPLRRRSPDVAALRRRATS
mmetsp:Transcript_15038/g.46781  ORF Transcript_15038/g.46781 Transcript_15038/m.46781 type:complete len:125 (+) Transcript_15038:580-954(+)